MKKKSLENYLDWQSRVAGSRRNFMILEIGMYLHLCVCVCVKNKKSSTHTDTHTNTDNEFKKDNFLV